jgi:hypothetical protein
MAKHRPVFYDLNIMIWEDDGGYTFSVIQESDEAGKDTQVLAKGTGLNMPEVLQFVKDAVEGALTE